MAKASISVSLSITTDSNKRPQWILVLPFTVPTDSGSNSPCSCHGAVTLLFSASSRVSAPCVTCRGSDCVWKPCFKISSTICRAWATSASGLTLELGLSENAASGRAMVSAPRVLKSLAGDFHECGIQLLQVPEMLHKSLSLLFGHVPLLQVLRRRSKLGK